jgi:hypothetical protein
MRCLQSTSALQALRATFWFFNIRRAAKMKACEISLASRPHPGELCHYSIRDP